MRRLSGLLACVCAVAVFLYGVFLLMAVSHAAQLSGIDRNIQMLTAQLSAEENTYLSEAQSLGPAAASAMGLIKPAAVSIVYTSAASPLSFNH